MSKKKIRKPKKRAPMKARKKGDQIVYVTDEETGQKVCLNDLIERYPYFTNAHEMGLVYDAYYDYNSPFYNSKKATEVLERLVDMKDPYGCTVKGSDLLYDHKEDEAFPLILIGVQAKNPNAIFLLGVYYFYKRDNVKAVQYFSEAADLGVLEAAYNAFNIYRHEEAVKDNERSQYYLNLAFKGGYDEVMRETWIYNLYQPLNQRNEEIALEALKKMITLNHDDARMFLEYTYIVTDLSDPTFFELLNMFKTPDDHINLYLAHCYMFGIGTQVDVKKAISYYQAVTPNKMITMMLKYIDEKDPFNSLLKAAKSNKACCYYVGKMYEHGTYTAPSKDLAEMFYAKGIGRSYPENQYAYAHLKLFEEDSPHYDELIVLLAEEIHVSRLVNELDCLRDLYTIYHYGIGVEADEKTAQGYAEYTLWE